MPFPISLGSGKYPNGPSWDDGKRHRLGNFFFKKTLRGTDFLSLFDSIKLTFFFQKKKKKIYFFFFFFWGGGGGGRATYYFVC